MRENKIIGFGTNTVNNNCKNISGRPEIWSVLGNINRYYVSLNSIWFVYIQASEFAVSNLVPMAFLPSNFQDFPWEQIVHFHLLNYEYSGFHRRPQC